MSKKESIEFLKKLGLTEYEAKAYVALTRIKTGIVSEIHLVSGIPRSAVYDVLNKLKEKGIIDVQQAKPIRYKVIPPKKCIEKLKEDFIIKSEDALNSLEEIYKTGEVESSEEAVWTISGIKNISDRVVEMFKNARTDIIFMTSHPFFPDIAEVYPLFVDFKSLITKKREKGVRVRVVGPSEKELMDVVKEISGVEVRTHAIQPERLHMPLKGGLLLVDGSEVLLIIFGDVSLRVVKGMTAIWSNGVGFVSIFKHLIETEWDASTPSQM
ncbi:MAG: helix-turn-helix domain-containing protein [Methanocellales archaeon]|nr:helix-turn-helix domain-containing protein [Methanocellales archaeon]